MESAARELFFILVLIYLVDCFRWVARSAVLVRVMPLWGASVGPPWQVGAQFRRALAFAFPLPVGSLFVAEPLAVRPGPHGVLVPAPGERSWALPSTRDTLVPWEALGTLRVLELELVGPQGVLHTFSSRAAAGATAAALAQLQAMASQGQGKRKGQLEALLEERFESAAPKALLRRWRWARLPVVFANLLLFAAIFGGLGVVSFAARPPETVRVLAAVGATWLVAGLVTVFTARRLLPKERRPSKAQWATTLLSPLSLMHSGELVEGELLGGVEPAVLASVLLPPKLSRAFLQRGRRELAHPLVPEGLVPLDAEAQAGLDWLRAQLGVRLLALEKTLPEGGEAAAPKGLHCPRCLTGYLGDVAVCSSCPGVALRGAAP